MNRKARCRCHKQISARIATVLRIKQSDWLKLANIQSECFISGLEIYSAICLAWHQFQNDRAFWTEKWDIGRYLKHHGNYFWKNEPKILLDFGKFLKWHFFLPLRPLWLKCGIFLPKQPGHTVWDFKNWEHKSFITLLPRLKGEELFFRSRVHFNLNWSKQVKVKWRRHL